MGAEDNFQLPYYIYRNSYVITYLSRNQHQTRGLYE